MSVMIVTGDVGVDAVSLLRYIREVDVLRPLPAGLSVSVAEFFSIYYPHEVTIEGPSIEELLPEPLPPAVIEDVPFSQEIAPSEDS